MSTRRWPPSPWGICQRSGRRLPRDEMVEDGQLKGLLVDPRWYEPQHPQERPARVKEEIAVRRPASENTDPDQSTVVEFPRHNLTTGAYELLNLNLTIQGGAQAFGAESVAAFNSSELPAWQLFI